MRPLASLLLLSCTPAVPAAEKVTFSTPPEVKRSGDQLTHFVLVFHEQDRLRAAQRLALGSAQPSGLPGPPATGAAGAPLHAVKVLGQPAPKSLEAVPGCHACPVRSGLRTARFGPSFGHCTHRRHE